MTENGTTGTIRPSLAPIAEGSSIEMTEGGNIGSLNTDGIMFAPRESITSIKSADTDTSVKRKKRRSSIDSVEDAFDAIGAAARNFFDPTREEFKWLRVVLTALIVGCVEYIPTLLLAFEIQYRGELIRWSIDQFGVHNMIGIYVGFAMVCASASAILVVYFAPAAAGSGLPQIIRFLKCGKTDGSQFGYATLTVKVFSTCLAIASSLAIGREGPAIHIGAAVGFIVYQKLEDWLGPKDRDNSDVATRFSGDELHICVIMGCVAGFASAFRAPVGAVLYTMEELAHHWDMDNHKALGGKTFICSALAALTIHFLLDMASSGDGIEFNSIVITADTGAHHGFYYYDLIYAIIIAIICGLFSGTFSLLSLKMFKLRKFGPEWLRTPTAKVLDVTILAGITALVFSWAPSAFGCEKFSEGKTNDDADDDHRRLAGGASNRNYYKYHCSEDNEYNELASMSLAGSEGVVVHLFSRDEDEFGLPAIVAMLLLYSPLAILVAGTTIPAGTFIPSLLTGALIGRFIGTLAKYITPQFCSDPGVFAIIGASAMLGGWTRTLLAIVVVMFEITGDVSAAIPIILATKISAIFAAMIEPEGYTHALAHLGEIASGDHEAVPPCLWIHPSVQERIEAVSAKMREQDMDDGTHVGFSGKEDANQASRKMRRARSVANC